MSLHSKPVLSQLGLSAPAEQCLKAAIRGAFEKIVRLGLGSGSKGLHHKQVERPERYLCRAMASPLPCLVSVISQNRAQKVIKGPCFAFPSHALPLEDCDLKATSAAGPQWTPGVLSLFLVSMEATLT